MRLRYPMKIIRHLKKKIPESFNARLLTYLFVSMVVLTVVSNLIFIQLQKKMLTDHLIEEGKTVTRLLAHNVRLGVFSENEEQLRNSVDAVFEQEGVLAVLVFNENGELLNKGRTQSIGQQAVPAGFEMSRDIIMNRIKTSPFRSTYLEDTNRFVFWEPVLANPDFYSEENLYFSDGLVSNRERLIGFVAVSVTKEILKKGVRAILWRNMAIAILFLLLSCLVIYCVLREVTRPLARLIDDVKQRGVQIDTKDELGMLTDTYSSLVETLAESFETINELKEGLEDTVAKRTRELALANEKLAVRQKFLEEANRRLFRTLQELKETQSQLVQSEKMAALGQLVAGVAHEINNTINFISGAVPNLKRKMSAVKDALTSPEPLPSPEKSEEEGKNGEQEHCQEAASRGRKNDHEKLLKEIDILLANINEGASRTTSIVQDLKHFSRSDETEFKLSGIHQGLDSTLALLSHEYKDRIEIIKEYDPELPVISCLPGQINQVFMNILVNAIQAIAGKGTIRIKTWHDNGKVHISIKDNGRGIPADMLPKIFDPFFSTKEIGEGTGLGLGISFGIIKKHQGEIKVTSEVGKGSDFEVILPSRIAKAGNSRIS